MPAMRLITAAAVTAAAVMLLASSIRLSAAQTPSTAPVVTSYDLVVSLAVASPDCFDRPVILINGQMSPTITVQQGNMLEVTVHNQLPVDYPEIGGGITIHWHGFSQYGHPWYDGTPFVVQCPIARGNSFTYSFLVTEAPGTYWYHDHGHEHRSDGLRGALIVLPAAGTPQPWQYDSEKVMLLGDWYHETAPAIVMQLNRPFDAAKVTNDTGAWAWAGNPQAILINSLGYYQDCTLFAGGGSGPTPPHCNVTVLTVPPGQSAIQPWASPRTKGCTHEQFTVVAGSTTRLRFVNAGSLLALIVCFEGHNVTVITSGVTPVEPYNTSCLPINIGERYDVLLTANQAPGNYWMNVQAAMRVGAPSGFGIFTYVGTNVSLPTTPTPQGTQLWPSIAGLKTIVTNTALLNGSNNTTSTFGSSFFPLGKTTLTPPQAADRSIVLNLTQPLVVTGMLRWAVNNIAAPMTTQCKAIASVMQAVPDWAALHLVNVSTYNYTKTVLDVTLGTGSGVKVYVEDALPMQVLPTVGMHFVEVSQGMVIDVVVNNLPGNANNGDYRPTGASRNASEQHPMHLHGHRFWVLGFNSNSGPYNATRDAASLNLVNPPYVDTWTALPYGWTVFRFIADNPGMWPLHCHIAWHSAMGQGVYLVEAEDLWPLEPKGFPSCPNPCIYDFAPFTASYVKTAFGNSGFEIPP